jgi:hypothetical protein
VIFHEQKSPEDYQTKNRSRGPYVRSTLDHTSGPLLDQSGQINGTGGPHVRSICEEDSGPDARSITSLTTPCLEWRTLTDLEGAGVTEIEVTEAERAELERLADIQQLPCNQPSGPIQINNYDLALGLMASGGQFVSWRDRN